MTTTLVYYAVLGIYALALSYITAYCLMQFHLLLQYRKHLKDPAAGRILRANGHEELPFVTIQLPVYNERFVVERLIDNILQQDYPRDRFEVHILDDSTDETVELVRRKVEYYKRRGFQIEQIRRPSREGYKAGALRDGLQYARGELIAIFDADFLPKPDFLRTTILHFRNPRVGVVQTRWEHLNEDYSLITRLQAMQLNVHFTVEQQGRKSGNYLLQFNGTAGLWRRQAIEDAGGWEADTLTEDLDLSIRAQLKGWEIVYLENIASPAELPAEMNSLKSQQFRWMKGGAETARKMLPAVWRSSLRFGQKVHATAHLLGSTVFVFVFIVGVFSVPLLFVLAKLNLTPHFLSIFLVGLLSIIAVYYVANTRVWPRNGNPYKTFLKFLFLFPLFLALSMGLSLHNTVAVVQGYLGRKSPFERTPKFNILSLSDRIHVGNYLPRHWNWTTFFEGLLTVYFLAAVFIGLSSGNTIFLVFHTLLALGYGTIFYYTIRHLRLK
ncbi:MAG: glycosyltransferase [Bacteroidetes bacterium]|nr:MAG: glycosyltransferase [Bacteroidota bacterium]